MRLRQFSDLEGEENQGGDVEFFSPRRRRFVITRITRAFPIHEWGFSLGFWNLNLLEVFENKYIFIAFENTLLRYPLQNNGAPAREPDKRRDIGYTIHFVKRGRLCGIEVVAITNEIGGVEIFDCESFTMIGSALHTPDPPQEDESVWSMDIRGNLVVIGSNTHILQVIEFRNSERKKGEWEEKAMDNVSTLDTAVKTEPSSLSPQLLLGEHKQQLYGREDTHTLNINPPSSWINDSGTSNDNASSSDEWGIFKNLLLTSRTLRYIEGHNHNIPSVVLNSRGDQALTACIDATVRIIDIRDGVTVKKSQKKTSLGVKDWMWNAVFVPQNAVYQIPHSPERTMSAEEHNAVNGDESKIDEWEQTRLCGWMCCCLPRWPKRRAYSPAEPLSKVERQWSALSKSPSAVILNEEIVIDEDHKSGDILLNRKSECQRVSHRRVSTNPFQLRQGQSTGDYRVTHNRTKGAVIFRAIKKTWNLDMPSELIELIMAYASEFYVLSTSEASEVFGSKNTYLHLHDSELNLVRNYRCPLAPNVTPGTPRSPDRLQFCFRLGESPVYCVASPARRNILLVGVVQDHNGEVNLRTYGDVMFNTELDPTVGPSIITGVTAAELSPMVYRLYVTRSTVVGNPQNGYIEAHDIEINLPW